MFNFLFSLSHFKKLSSWEQFYETETPEKISLSNLPQQYSNEGNYYFSCCYLNNITVNQSLIRFEGTGSDSIQILFEAINFENITCNIDLGNSASDGLLHISDGAYAIYRCSAAFCFSTATAFAYLRGLDAKISLIESTTFSNLGIEDSNWGPYIERGNESIKYFNTTNNIAYRGSAFYFSHANSLPCHISYSEIAYSNCSGTNNQGYCVPIYFGNNGNGQREFEINYVNFIKNSAAQYTQCFSVRSYVTMNSCSFIAGPKLTLIGCYIDPLLSTSNYGSTTFVNQDPASYFINSFSFLPSSCGATQAIEKTSAFQVLSKKPKYYHGGFYKL